MEQSVRVAKFGGSSLNDVECIRQAARVVQSTTANVVVVSAMGGITNALVSLSERAITTGLKECLEEVEHLAQRHLTAAEALACDTRVIHKLIEEARVLITGMNLLAEVSPRSKDRLLSIGERLSSTLMTAALREIGIEAVKVDATSVVITDASFGQAEPIIACIAEAASQHIMPHLSAGDVIVTQGFIGATADGMPTTLGRGGSDYSAALLAEALKAEHLAIWTDVPGILQSDPRIIPESRAVPELSFDEAAELATFGATVLHPATLCPAIRCNIPVFVASTMHPEKGGTWIRRKVDDTPVIRGIAVRRKQILLTAKSFMMFHAHGFLANFFSILARHRISVDLVTTSEVSVAITVNTPARLTEEIIKELREVAQIEIDDDLALVALVGNRLTTTPGIADRVFSIIKRYNIRFISYGASDRNFCFLVNENQLNEVVTLLNEIFLEKDNCCTTTEGVLCSSQG